MITQTLDRLIRIGVENAPTESEKRNIKLSNFLCLVMGGALCLISLFRLIVATPDQWFYAPLLTEAMLFLGLIWLNHLGFVNLSRILLCWMPSVFLMVDFRIVILNVPVAETSHFLGFRIFQVAFSVFPFLIFNVSETRKFLLALFLPAVIVVGYDRILDEFGIGYYQMGLTDTSYLYNNFRTVIALLILGSAFVFLKKILERQELKNESLIRQLEQQNVIIQKNSERALKKAYERLSYHINNTPLAVIERDENFKITYWNKRAEELFGWSADEVIGLKPQNIIVYPGDSREAIKLVNQAIEEKRDSNFMEIRAITKDGRILNCLWYYSFLRDEQGKLDTVLSFISDITEQRQANYHLNERIKELKTLYNVSQLLTNSGKSMEDVFSTLPELLPKGWQFPEACAAQLTIFGNVYQTPNFQPSSFGQSLNIMIAGKQMGRLEVVYLEKKPSEYEGPFYKEERDLLNAIVQMLQVYVERKIEEEELVKAQANLFATINNTEIIIWSVDTEFKLNTYNQAFTKFVEEILHLEISSVSDAQFFPSPNSTAWEDYYKRVFTGEVFTFEDTTAGLDFRYSLSPIIDNAKIIGVSIFANDMTEQNQRNRELAEANKKIADLKMMALRSVMNPHFIFNVLSSIQYFITRNDELNAVNYLTSFSKLMRTVLTRSVADLVSLKDELDLLRDYVHLEKLRFEEKFEFNIECDSEIGADDLMMPSLLIQPYVENAILHGLYNKEGKGSLTVKVSLRDEDFLLFEIEDDGVGRSVAEKLRERSGSKKNSMGTKLTEERLLLLNNDGQPPVVYRDLFSDGKPSGTLVSIHVKINPN